MEEERPVNLSDFAMNIYRPDPAKVLDPSGVEHITDTPALGHVSGMMAASQPLTQHAELSTGPSTPAHHISSHPVYPSGETSTPPPSTPTNTAQPSVFAAACLAHPMPTEGVHEWVLTIVAKLYGHIPDEELIKLLCDRTCGREGRMIEENEITGVVNWVKRQRGIEGSIAPSGPTPKPTPKWPLRDEELQRAIIANEPFTVEQLIDLSPSQVEGIDTEEFIDALFPELGALLCPGWHVGSTSVRPRSEWRGFLSRAQYIVPNPMSGIVGVSGGKPSGRCIDNTGPRRYLIVEGDPPNSSDEEFHKQAAILRHLGKFAPLVLVVASRGKSFHGWFDCTGATEDQQREFFAYACTLGADPKMWTPCQFTRMPGGMRVKIDESTGEKFEIGVQCVVYFDREKIGKASVWVTPPKPRNLTAISPTPGAPTPLTADALLKLVDARAFDVDNLVVKPDPVFSLGNCCISTAGNLTAVQALAKAGKSSAVAAMIGAVFKGNGVGGDTLGFVAFNQHGRALIHIDTEQSRFDHDQLVRSTLKRAETLSPPPWFESVWTTDLAIDQRLAGLPLLMARAATRHGGVFAVIIDGGADLIASVNDEVVALALVEHLHRLAIQYECVVVVVLHENPGSTSGKTRGHFGSQLARKAETNLRLKKDKDGTTSVWADETRHEPILQANAYCFKWCSVAAMHVSAGRSGEIKDAETLATGRAVATQVFEGHSKMTNTGLKKAIMNTIDCSESTAVNRIREWMKAGLIGQLVDRGPYHLVTEAAKAPDTAGVSEPEV
jgi:hypothetical protein